MVLIVSLCLQGCHIRGCFVGYAVHKLIGSNFFYVSDMFGNLRDRFG